VGREGTRQSHEDQFHRCMERIKKKDKTKKQLINEAAELRQRVAELEELETRHNQVEETLRQGAEKYRTILENIEEGYFEVDLAGNLTFFNEALCRIHGRTHDELMGLNNREFSSPETAKRIYAIFNKVYRTGIPARIVDYEVVRKDGSVAMVEESVSLLRNASGEPIGFYGVSRDRTEQKKAEEGLRQSAEKYRTILESIQEGYYETDLAGNFTFFNNPMCRLLGYSKEELMGMNNRQYTDRENAKRLFQAFNQVYRTGEPGEGFDWEIVRKDGTQRTVEASFSLKKDGLGNPTGFRGIVRDITERKKAEETLRRSEETAKRLAQENAIMAEIGRIVSSTLNIGEIYEHFAEEVKKLIPFDRIAVNTINYDDGTVTIAYVTGVDVADRSKGTAIPLVGTLAGEVVRTRKSMVIQAEAPKKVADRFPGLFVSFQAGIRSVMAIPLISKDEVVGALHFHSRKLNAYREKDLRLAEEVGNQIGGAISNAQLFIERKKAEEALRQSEERYRAILENIEDGYYEVDLAGKFTFFNDSMCRIYGYPKEELMGMNHRQYTDQETAKKVFRAYNQVYRTGEPGRVFDYQLIRKDETKRYVEASISLLKDPSGKPIGFRGIVRDITERKQAEEALRQSEEKYRTILESMEEGYYEVDLAGNFTFINDSMCRALGYSKEELIGMNNRQYTDQENAKRLFQAFNEVYRTGKPGRGFDHELIRKDGSKRYAEGSIVLQKDFSGKPIGFRGIARDITERKKFERILQQERETFFSILQKEPYGALLINTDETFLYINSEFTAITGYTIKDVPNGREWFRKAYPNPEYRHKIIAVWKQDIIPRKGVDRVWSVVCKNGEVKEIEFKLTFLDDGRVIVMLSDVTERKRTEEELAYKATHDLLTGLPNRMLFKDRFNVAMAQAQRFRKKLAVVFLDLDRFKEVNDTLGHDAGDRLLHAVGNRLTDLVRKTDTVARMGGDEFLLLLSNIERMEDVATISQSVLDVLRQPFIVDGREVSISASIGVAIYPDGGADVDTLVSRADKAMYEVKQKGNGTDAHLPQAITEQTSE
jgi:diguanylate cyclase (GGDEF)-like protein/PAS domain S-box-containing protein